MSIEDFYNTIKTNSKNTELNKLYKKPVSEVKKYMPSSQIFEKNIYYQADVLYMPEDDGYSYILVCVDMYDSSVDAEPIKKVDVDNVLIAFKQIFKRKYLKYPVFITFDKGTEFNSNKIIEYFKKHKTNIKYGLTGRSRMLANVERMNQTIGTILFKRMTSQELLTGEVSKEWVDDLKPLIKVLNLTENKKIPLKQEIDNMPIVDKWSGDLLRIGQNVRLLLDYPINNTNKSRIYGKFRSTDVRWTQKIYKITEVLLKPGYPPMYLTDINDNVARTKNQLNKVSRNEKEPDNKFIRGNPEHHIIKKILNKKIENGKTFYLTQYKGYNENNAIWEHTSIYNRTNDLKELRKAYNDIN